MSVASHHDFLIPPEEYLAGEELNADKHEYLNGVVHAMAGGTKAHARLGSNIAGLLYNRLRGKTCQPYNSDMRLRVQHERDLRFYYPDAMIVCRESASDHWQDEPVVICEVLSENTARIDHGEKRSAYLSIPTLDAYVLVDSRKVEVLVYHRAGAEWRTEALRDFRETLRLETVACELPLVEIYEGTGLLPTS
jgi:Uma2 family endonuclease